ncbi:hypothetical protein [Ferrovibrio sp.]|uniref:hypothetical protein n=1 Tax=Ferrovibrio sp. TaxID=1917215 RepID=UPI0025C31C19|nr:hypothetical protein [Ferrovibrio sp.]MBX3456707.1 hypothetical protein [Ferrovibrio sp.]
MSNPVDMEISITGATYRSASEVVARKPYVRNVRLVGRMWVADVPGEGDGLTVGRLPDDLAPQQIEEIYHPGLSTGIDNYGLTKQGAYYDSSGLFAGPGLGLVNNETLRRWLPWILVGLVVVALVAVEGRTGVVRRAAGKAARGAGQRAARAAVKGVARHLASR